MSPGAPSRFLHVGPRTRNAKTSTAICFPKRYAKGRRAEGPKSSLGESVHHRTSRDTNNRIEHDHRGLKQRSYPMRGFGSFDSAARCCSAYAEQRQYFRAQARPGAIVSAADRRRRCQDRRAGIIAALAAA